MRDGGVEEELVFGEGFGGVEVCSAAGGVKDFLGALLERGFELESS